LAHDVVSGIVPKPTAIFARAGLFAVNQGPPLALASLRMGWFTGEGPGRLAAPPPVDWRKGEHRALTARRYLASFAGVGIVRDLRANPRVRIRSEIPAANIVHVRGGAERTLRLLILSHKGLRRLGAGPVGRMLGPRQSRTGDRSNQRHSREEFDHSIVSMISLWVIARAGAKRVSHVFNA